MIDYTTELGYYPQMKDVKPRSSFVSFIAWSFIVISVYSVFMGIFQMFVFIGMQITGTLQPMLDMLNSPELKNAGSIHFIINNMVSISLFSAFISLLTLYASIALLRRREWARKLFQGLLVVIIISSFGGLFYHFQPPPTDPAMAEVMGDLPYGNIAEIINMTVKIISLSSVAIHGWLMWKLNKDEIKEEFY